MSASIHVDIDVKTYVYVFARESTSACILSGMCTYTATYCTVSSSHWTPVMYGTPFSAKAGEHYGPSELKFVGKRVRRILEFAPRTFSSQKSTIRRDCRRTLIQCIRRQCAQMNNTLRCTRDYIRYIKRLAQ